MIRFLERRPIWSIVILLAIAAFLWLIFAAWPAGLEQAIGKKKVFLSAVFNGITLGGLYFLVASGFTLIFGLLRNVNLAHGSLYLLGGYVGYNTIAWTGSWLVGLIVAFAASGLVGIALQVLVFRRMEGQELRQTMVTIGISIVMADLMLWIFGADFYQIMAPKWLAGPLTLPFVTAIKSSGEAVYLSYPIVRLAILAASIVVGLAIWLALNQTRIGMIIRAGVDDREILAATGIPIQHVFVIVFALGAGLAGIAGVVGGTFQSVAPGEDTRFLLASLIVVIVGGVGSIPGAALGAVLVGLAEQLGSVYIPTYAIVVTFLIMVLVLAVRPQGLLARR
ncbi:MAG TPA: branched-chain amino acid ABC transporter permease [Roseiarcus sp.]|jgi:branched-chain amino acid transport system permease protein|nr:branched-chain amino acid ABC transporter permease [Roseiarcus sp.]